MKRFLVRALVVSLVFAAAMTPLAAAGRVAVLQTSLGEIKVRLLDDIAPKTVENFAGLAAGNKEWTDPRTGEKTKRPFYDGLIFHRVIPDFMIQGGCPLGTGTGGPGYQFEDETMTIRPAKGTVQDPATARLVWEKVLTPYLQKNGTGGDGPLQALYKKIVAANSLEPLVGKDLADLCKAAGLSGIPAPRHGITYGTLCMANAGPDTNGSQFFIVTKKDGCAWLDGKHTVFGEVISGMDVAEKIQAQPRNAQDKPTTPVVIRSVRIVAG